MFKIFHFWEYIYYKETTRKETNIMFILFFILIESIGIYFYINIKLNISKRIKGFNF